MGGYTPIASRGLTWGPAGPQAATPHGRFLRPPRLDSPSVFPVLLDHSRGWRFSLGQGSGNLDE